LPTVVSICSHLHHDVTTIGRAVAGDNPTPGDTVAPARDRGVRVFCIIAVIITTIRLTEFSNAGTTGTPDLEFLEDVF
jgi:hypothetical protein